MSNSNLVAACCRVSTLEQKKKGLGMDIQVRDVTAFAEAQNLTIARFYLDEAQSGTSENRKTLKKLVRDCERGIIGTIIIPALDRLRQERTRKGRAPGGNTPYGYSRNAKRLVENVSEARIVRTIFELSGLGYSSADVAKELREAGEHQRNDAPWSSRQVRSVLARRALYESGLMRYGN